MVKRHIIRYNNTKFIEKVIRLNLYFIRHAESIYRPEDEDFNRPLSEKGKADAKHLIDKFENIEIGKIYSSPYFRALNTVQGIAEEKELDIEIINNLRERKVAENYIDDFQTFSTSQWKDFKYSLPGGESLKEVQKRGIKALNKIIDNPQDENVNIIAGGHGTWLGVILNYFDKNYGYDYWKELKMPDIFLFEFENSNVKSIKRIDTGI